MLYAERLNDRKELSPLHAMKKATQCEESNSAQSSYNLWAKLLQSAHVLNFLYLIITLHSFIQTNMETQVYEIIYRGVTCIHTDYIINCVGGQLLLICLIGLSS